MLKLWFAQGETNPWVLTIWILDSWKHMSDCCSMTNWQFSAEFMTRKSYIWWDDDVCFVLDQLLTRPLVRFYSSSSQSVHRHVTPFQTHYSLFWFKANQSLFLIINAACLAGDLYQFYKPMIYCTRGEHAYTSEAVHSTQKQ
jgi:hypothetical protein